jgi:hypothetical protein
MFFVNVISLTDVPAGDWALFVALSNTSTKPIANFQQAFTFVSDMA